MRNGWGTSLSSSSTEACLSGLCGVGMQARCCPCLVNSLNVGLAPSARRAWGNCWRAFNTGECPERGERHSQRCGIHTGQGFPGFGHWYWRWKAVRDGINLQEDSESEQESEPYRGDHSAAIDHSVGSGRRRVGFLFWFCLSPPLALRPVNTKHW